MKWRYSRRMIRVRCILVETTVPVRIRPRMETRPVKGHFLSVGVVWSVTIHVTVFGMPHSAQGLLELLPAQHLVCGGACLRLEPHIDPIASPSTERLFNKLWEMPTSSESRHTDVLSLNGSLGGTETQTNILVPPALFLLVSFRTLVSLRPSQHQIHLKEVLTPPLPGRLVLLLVTRETWGCFWKARSDWTVNSVAMFADVLVGRERGR